MSKRGRRGKARSFGPMPGEGDVEVISLDGSDAAPAGANDDDDDDVGSVGSEDGLIRKIDVDKIEETFSTEAAEWRLFAPVRVKRVEHRGRALQVSSGAGLDANLAIEGDPMDTGTTEIDRIASKYRGVYQDDDG